MPLFLNTVLFILISSIFPAGVNLYSIDDGKFKGNQKLPSMLLIVTLNGQWTALDANNNNVLWSKKHDQALLSTSHLSLLHNKNGKKVRAIPSFDRYLFECEGNSLVQVPIDLNQNQWNFSDGTILRHTMQTSLRILDPYTGKELFYAKCFDPNCKDLLNSYALNFTSTSSKQVIVEKRVTHTVRSEESNSDVKKNPWSYTVTDVQLLLRNQLLNPFQALSKQSQKCDKQRLNYFYHNYNMCLGKFHIMRRSSNKSLFSHNHHLQSPIAFAWIHSDGKLCKLDLFRTCHTTPDLQTSNPISSRFFVGRYRNQIYLQTSRLSPTLQEKVTVWPKKLQTDLNADFCQKCKCRLLSQSAANINADKDIELNICIEAHLATLDICLDDSNFENDFYVYENSNVCTDTKLPLSEEQCVYENKIDESIVSICGWVIVAMFSLLFFLCFFTPACSIKVPCFIQRKLNLKLGKRLDRTFDEYCVVPSGAPLQQNETSTLRPPSNRLKSIASTSADLKGECEFNPMSRFLQDFKPFLILGSGGFGTVFKVKHKIDQGIYAVKCIELDANDADHPTKRLRESKVLAKLQHENIIRYYSSWIENSSEDLEQAWSDVQSSNFSSGNELDMYKNSNSTRSYIGEKNICAYKLKYVISLSEHG